MNKTEKSIYKARELYDRLSGRKDLTPLQQYICDVSGTIVLLADDVDSLECEVDSLAYQVSELETEDL